MSSLASSISSFEITKGGAIRKAVSWKINQSEHAILDEERCEDGYPQSPNSTQKEIGYAELKVPYK